MKALKNIVGLLALPVLLLVSTTSFAADYLDKYPGFTREAELVDYYENMFLKQEEQRENVIQKCMSEAGFDYIPLPPISLDIGGSPDEAEELIALFIEAEEFANSVIPSDPRNYNLALYGTADPDNPEGGDFELEIARGGGGCIGVSERSVIGIYDISSTLLNEYHDMEKQISDDPDIKAVERDWSSCMSNKGLQFENRVTMMSEVNESTVSRGEESVLAAEKIRVESQNCMEVVNYAERSNTVITQYRNVFADEHRDVLDASLRSINEQEAQLTD